MKKFLSRILPVLILAAGMALFLYPDFVTWQQKIRGSEIISKYEELGESEEAASQNDQEKDSGKEEDSGSDKKADEESEENGEEMADPPGSRSSILKDLSDELKKYNADIAANGQNLTDCWSYENNPIALEYMPENSDGIGKIIIPDMDVNMPLLLGASSENLKQGAAVLAGTSMPIGGESTNCVIAAHRSLQGVSFFRNIQNMEKGSKVYIQNPWETLTYVAVKAEIIEPDDLRCLEIRKGEDIVTLITCHPYMGNSQYRYVVYCVREGTVQESTETEKSGDADSYAAEDTEPFITGNDLVDTETVKELDAYSARMIFIEVWLRYGLAAVFILWWSILLIKKIIRNRKVKAMEKAGADSEK